MITGLDAAIDDVPCLERFNIVTTGFDDAIACSDSGGAVIRSQDTNLDWTGVAIGYGYLPPKLPGAKFTFTGIDKNNTGWKSSVNGAIVDAVQIFCDPNASALMYYHLYFSANGSLTRGTYSFSNSVIPNPASSTSRVIKRGSTTISDTLYWDLLLNGNNADPLWPGGGGGWPVRDAGNLDAAIKWRQGFDDPGNLPAMNTFEIYKLYCTAAYFWEIKWAKVLELPANYVIRNKENKPEYNISECTAKFSGYFNSTQGYIKTPEASPVTIWGAA